MLLEDEAGWAAKSGGTEPGPWLYGIIGENVQLSGMRHAWRQVLRSGIGVRRYRMEVSTQLCLLIASASNTTCNGWAVSRVFINISWHTRNYWQVAWKGSPSDRRWFAVLLAIPTMIPSCLT